MMKDLNSQDHATSGSTRYEPSPLGSSPALQSGGCSTLHEILDDTGTAPSLCSAGVSSLPSALQGMEGSCRIASCDGDLNDFNSLDLATSTSTRYEPMPEGSSSAFCDVHVLPDQPGLVQTVASPEDVLACMRSLLLLKAMSRNLVVPL